MHRAAAAAAFVIVAALFAAPEALVSAQTDLDAFMQQVLARRDDNWKKLQQYILDEREQIELRGPSGRRLWGEQRDFTWYVRDGFFVRSPVRVNGVTIGEADRREYEADYQRRAQRRDQRGSGRQAPGPDAQAPEDGTPADVAGLIRQSRQPQFISSAYFLRYRFDEGTYALAGREQLEGREVLRIEYYPTRLFSTRRRGQDGRDRENAELRRLMNQVALVTLWIEPSTHQIVKSTYDNVTFDFLPVPWLVRVDDVNASMTMHQPFPDVWLPRGLEMDVSMTLALGPVDFRYTLEYHDYRQADATIRVR